MNDQYKELLIILTEFRNKGFKIRTINCFRYLCYIVGVFGLYDIFCFRWYGKRGEYIHIASEDCSELTYQAWGKSCDEYKLSKEAIPIINKCSNLLSELSSASFENDLMTICNLHYTIHTVGPHKNSPKSTFLEFGYLEREYDWAFSLLKEYGLHRKEINNK